MPSVVMCLDNTYCLGMLSEVCSSKSLIALLRAPTYGSPTASAMVNSNISNFLTKKISETPLAGHGWMAVFGSLNGLITTFFLQ
jgi:hypothetical protein